MPAKHGFATDAELKRIRAKIGQKVTQSEVRNPGSFRSAWPHCAANQMALYGREFTGAKSCDSVDLAWSDPSAHRPNAFAVSPLMINSNFVGCSAGSDSGGNSERPAFDLAPVALRLAVRTRRD